MCYNEIPYASVVNLLDYLLHLVLENVFLIRLVLKLWDSCLVKELVL